MSYFPDHTPRRSPTPSSPLTVVPPIIKNERDRDFLQGLTGYINTEMTKTDPLNTEQRYIIHKAAFDKVNYYLLCLIILDIIWIG